MQEQLDDDIEINIVDVSQSLEFQKFSITYALLIS